MITDNHVTKLILDYLEITSVNDICSKLLNLPSERLLEQGQERKKRKGEKKTSHTFPNYHDKGLEQSYSLKTLDLGSL